ncbi:MAG: phosphoglucosamine mutase [Planctomycetes bacterium]|nr:phosphoglucosamine mutase [Planctomycetota bacterium]
MAAEGGLIVSVSGVRGVVGEGLTASAALAFASALGTHLGGGRIVLGRDGRPSGSLLRHAVLAGLLEAGCAVQDVGVAPTPTVGLAVCRLQAAGAIQITASHNPAPWNGLKLFGGDGRVLAADEGRRVRERFEAGDFRRAPWSALGTVEECRRAEDWHCDRVLELVDAPRIRAAGLCAFLDANGGAGGPLGRRLLEAFQVGAVCKGYHADGCFEHAPEPTAENLREVAPLVAKLGADVGFALDPDADRLALIDEMGRCIGEELTLALAVRFRLSRARGPVVINMSTSRVVEDVAAGFGCPCHRAAVGEANVADRMLETDAVIGGEGNGGVIDPRVGLVRDPFLGMGLVLNLMAETDLTLSELVAELPVYHIVKDKYDLDPGRLSELFQVLEGRWPEARTNRLDGLRLDWEDRWVHVRPSNTEPIVRVIAEARRKDEARDLCRAVGAMLQN